MTTAAARERAGLSDLLAERGPDATTLCEGWVARDLAAHLVVRERRPDAAVGFVVKKLGGHTEKVHEKIAATPWEELVDTVRTGPPVWSPTRLDPVDRLANTVEFFVHHEDVRRAEEPWEPRELAADLADDLYRVLKRMAKLLTRSAPAGLVLAPADGRSPIEAHKGEPAVTVRGPVGELVLFVYGRQDQARVDFEGEPASVEAIRSASFGF